MSSIASPSTVVDSLNIKLIGVVPSRAICVSFSRDLIKPIHLQHNLGMNLIIAVKGLSHPCVVELDSDENYFEPNNVCSLIEDDLLLDDDISAEIFALLDEQCGF